MRNPYCAGPWLEIHYVLRVLMGAACRCTSHADAPIGSASKGLCVAQAYYRRVRRALAVLPAFASDVYLKQKSSSSVAAAIVCGTPLIANPRLLASYPYLSKVSTCPAALSLMVEHSVAEACWRSGRWSSTRACNACCSLSALQVQCFEKRLGDSRHLLREAICSICHVC